MITLATPPLANDPASPHTSSTTIVGLELRQETSRLVTLLTSITHGREQWNQHIGSLRNAFLYLPTHEIVEICGNLSHAIINRNPAGRYWGSSMTLRTAQDSSQSNMVSENQLNELQFAHRVIDEKLIAHGLLLKTLNESDVKIEHVLLMNHMKVALCAGLAEAIEAQNTNEDADLQDAIRALTWSIEQAVKLTYQDNLHEISSKGLTLYDQFFADVDKAVDIFSLSLKLVCQHVKQCTSGSLYKLLFLYYTAMKLATEKGGFDTVNSDDYHPLAMQNIRSMMTNLCGEIAVVFAANNQQLGQSVEVHAPERQRVGDFCTIILTVSLHF